MGRMIVLLLATLGVWGSVGWVWSLMGTPDNGAYLILGVIAFLTTAVIWAVGGNIAVYDKSPASRRDTFDRADDKPKRNDSSLSLGSVVDTLTPEQVASLEIALQRRRDSFDEDEQILAHRLAAEMERDSRNLTL